MDPKMAVKVVNLIMEFVLVFIVAICNWWAWNRIAPGLFYWLPKVYHEIGFWDLFCVFFVWRSIWTVARQPMKVNRKDLST